jgi:hypothetical protein
MAMPGFASRFVVAKQLANALLETTNRREVTKLLEPLIACEVLILPTFRTPIHRFLEIAESATNPGTMRLFSSRPNIFLNYRYLGTLWPTAPILRSSRENRFSM